MANRAEPRLYLITLTWQLPGDANGTKMEFQVPDLNPINAVYQVLKLAPAAIRNMSLSLIEIEEK